MTVDELIGSAGASYLCDRLAGQEATGVARFLLDCLTAGQTAGIARAILADPSLASQIETRLPAVLLEGQGLPPETLTNERTTFFRNAACSRPALLVANVGDDEEQSLKELVPIGAPQLLSHPDLWVTLAASELPITEQHRGWWTKALEGLNEVRSFALEQYGAYVLQTRQAIEEGHPILAALGFALPAIRAPRDTSFFRNLNDKTAGHASKWKALYGQAFKRRANYLLKRTPTQGVLLQEDLAATFEKVKDAIPEKLHLTVRGFIEAPGGWNAEAVGLAQCEWELVKPLFDGLKREKFNLGKATSDFYAEREADLLTADERDYLGRLSQRNYTEAEEEDEEFYKAHQNELKEQPSLRTKWDRFVFGSPVDSDDFLVGIVQCLRSLFSQDMPSAKRRLTIRCERRTKKDLRELNEEAGLLFARRYKGLKALFGGRVTWDLGELLNFEALSLVWRKAPKPHVNRSVAKSSLQLKFVLELEVELTTGTTQSSFKQLVWHYDPGSISCEFSQDWARLVIHPLVYCRVARDPIGSKGRYESLDLRNVRTMYAAYGQDRGSFVATFKPENDLSHIWQENLEAARANGLVSGETASNLLALFRAFERSYQAAVQGFVNEGLASEHLVQQAEDYGALLEAICSAAKGDRNREGLLAPLLQVGAISVTGGRITTIVAPWHPLRLGAMVNKAWQVASLVKHLLTADSVFLGDPPMFFRDWTQALSHPYYPDVVLGWQEKKPELLALTDCYLDYSLHESPVIGNDGLDDTNESPSDTAALVVGLTKRFLSLYPHERANLSVVLYNCDSARLPYALVNRMNELHEDNEEMRCEIVLRHRDVAKLRELYERIIESSEAEADSFVSSEAAKDFMARLRIAIMADQAPAPDPRDGPPADLVFLHDVIARHACLEWYLEAYAPVNSAQFVPPRWSRRRPSASDDMKSVAYLCCPVQTKEGWSHLTALTTFIKGDWDGALDKRLLPARKLDFSDSQTSAILKESHNLGNWVVNCDELLDRKHLLSHGIRVIRHKQGVAQGRNILVSSTAPLGLLRSMVLSRIRNLGLGLHDDKCKELAERFIGEANEVSGDLVLRAAKHGRHASELMGVVLSRYMIQFELGKDRRFGWYFLDDYAEWLGQREEHIADILALSPEETSEGEFRLSVIVSESKYIDHASLSVKRKESQKQLRDTVHRIDEALFGDPMRLDRELWLSRFSDLMLNGIQFPASSPLDLAAWRRAVREGKCAIHMRGYSHIFVSGPSESPECSDFVAVAGAPYSWQEVFSRSRVRELVLAYAGDKSPTDIRKENASQDIWAERDYRQPSGRIVLVPGRKAAAASSGAGTAAAGRSAANVGNATPSDDAPRPPSSSEPAPPPSAIDSGAWVGPQVGAVIMASPSASRDGTHDEDWLRQVESRCKGALQQFQLQSKLLSKTLTPNAAILRFQGGANLTVEQALKRRSEFLTTHGLQVISVTGEPGVVAIGVARQERRILELQDVWRTWNPNCKYGNHRLLVGLREEDGCPLFLSPKDNAPHTLIAGSTGSGKSVLMQNIILSIACTNTPLQAQIVLIDPKMGVDYFAFEGLPHLPKGIIDDDQAAVEALGELVAEMNRRYAVLKANKVANIFDLNKKEGASEHLPFLWVIHDEFAEWMLTEDYADTVSDTVSRLGVKARAAGISLVFAAQRPDANVMPMQLRANLGNRLVLRVDGEGTSEIALGEKGAERLLGKGHLAARMEGESSVVLAQVPLVSAALVEALVVACKTAGSR